MPGIGQYNPDVPSTAQIPDTYLYISTAPTSIGTTQPKDLFLVATGILGGSQITNAPYSLTPGTATPNEIKQYSDSARVNLAFHRKSPIANRFRSALQEVPIGINFYLASVQEPSNTLFAGFATKLLTFGGTAAGSGEIKIRVCGHECAVPVANGDTAATIAATAKSALDKLLDAPMVTARLIGGVTLPLTYVVRGADGNDSPILVEVPPELTGVTVSPGTITVATTSLGASGNPSLFTLQCDSTAYAVAIPVGSTPTQAAALIAAAINATTGPLAATAAASMVTLLHRSGWYCRKLQVSSTEDAAGQTYGLADRHDSAGAIQMVSTIAGNPALTGLGGAGAPILTVLLGNASKKAGGFSEWAVDYLDATSTSAIYSHVEQYGNGYYQKNQRVTFVSTDPLETAKTVATSATPQLGNSWRYAVGVYQGAACQGGAYAAQVAARLCATDLPYNMDGMQLVSGALAPMTPGRSETDLTPTSMDVALGSYKLFVLTGINGIVTVLRGKTVWTASNFEWGDWSYGRTFDAVRYGMRAFLNDRFRGRVLFRGGGTVRVPNGFTLQDVKDAIAEYLDSIDGVIVDGAKDLKRYIAAEPSQTDPGLIRIFFRERPPRELHIISGVVAAAA